jgi:hypothetical protein
MRSSSPFAAIIGLLTAICLTGRSVAAGETAPRLNRAFPATQPAIRTDRGVYPEPPLPGLPKAGGVIVDPTFGTSILRLTDESDGESCVNPYSYWPTFNRNSTRLYILCDDRPFIYDFDPQAFRASNKRALPKTPDNHDPRSEDMIWSGSDADVLFCHCGLKLWSYSVATQAYTLIQDFSTVLPPGHIAQMSKSLDDNTFAFTRQDPKWKAVGYVAWRRDADKILLNGAEPLGLDEVQVDKTGRYVLIKTEKQGRGVIQTRVADLNTGKIENLIDDAPDFAPGHSDNGRGMVIGADNWKNRYTRRELATPHQFLTVLDLHNDWSQDAHISLLADDENWVLMTFYVGNKLPNSGVFRNEIVLVRTDGSQQVRRLAHHRSVFRSYWDSPRANISRDGRFVTFTSTWGPSGRRDVFVLRVPPLEDQTASLAAVQAPALSAAIDRSPAANQRRLQTLLHRLVEDGKHCGPGVLWVEDHKKIMWFQGQAVAMIASAYPNAAEADKPALARYLKNEVTGYLLDEKYMQWESAGTLTRPGNETLRWSRNNAAGWMAVYGIYAYARATGDWELLKQNVTALKALWGALALPPSQIVASRNTFVLHNAQYNGAYAAAQIARQLDDDAWEKKALAAMGQARTQMLANVDDQVNKPASDGRIRFIVCLDCLTPESAAVYAADAQAREKIARLTESVPWWWMNGMNLGGAGGEGSFQPPSFASQVFLARAWILKEPYQRLARQLPWPNVYVTIPSYRDLQYVQNLAVLLDVARVQKATWQAPQPPAAHGEVLLPATRSDAGSGDWSQFLGNPQHTGAGDGQFPEISNPKLLW